MDGIKHNQYLSIQQNKFVKMIQAEMEQSKDVRPNKSQATAKIIDYLINNGINARDVIK